MCDTCVQSLIVIGTAINQLETKVSLKTICCLRLFVVVYKHVMLQHLRKLWVKDVYQVLLSSTVQLTLITTRCLRLFVVVYKVEMCSIRGNGE